MRRIETVVLALGLSLTVVGNAAAHHTFIMPDKFHVAKGEPVVVGFHSSDGFPESSQILKRLRSPTVHLPGRSVAIEGVREEQKRLVASITVPTSGYVIVTAVNATTTADMKADEFLAYLKEEGLTHVVEARAQRGETEKAAKERYTMYAKTILLVDTPDDAYKKPVGLPIEIVPETDPSQLKAGEMLPVRVLFRGAPAGNLEIMAASTSRDGGKQHSVGRTDASGRIGLRVVQGPWRLHTILMERSSKPDADWESFWATLTFEIR